MISATQGFETQNKKFLRSTEGTENGRSSGERERGMDSSTPGKVEAIERFVTI